MPGGSSVPVFAMAACTSWPAASMLRSSVNWIVMFVTPSALVEVIESMPAIVLNCLSSGVATAEAIVSGLAPGRFAITWIVGKSTFGRSLTGSFWYAITPKIRMAAISSVVRTGRRMKSSVFTTGSRRLRRLDLHARARNQAQLAVGDDALAGGEPLGDDRLGGQPATELHGPRLHGEVRLHHEHVRALLAGLDGLRRHHHRRLRGESQDDLHVLPGPQGVVGVVEGALELDRPRRRVHGVVDEREPAPGGLGRARRRRAHGERARRLVLLDGGEVLLRHRERDVDRVHLRDDDH